MAHSFSFLNPPGETWKLPRGIPGVCRRRSNFCACRTVSLLESKPILIRIPHARNRFFNMCTKQFNISRRSFLKTCSLTAAAAGLPGWFVERELATAGANPRPLSANDRPGIALVGCGGMGRGDATNASRFGDILALCDVDEKHVNQAAEQFSKDS